MQWLEEARGHLVGAGGLAVAMVVGFWAWLKTRPSRAQDKATELTAEAAWQDSIARMAESFTATMERLVSTQATQLAAYERRIGVLESENEQCRGENRQLHQRVDSLERALIRADIALPAPATTGPAIELDARSGLATPSHPRKPRRPRRSRNPKE